MSIFETIQTPTLLLNESTARDNLHRVSQKIRQAGIRFRPHFKTHQSAEIGDWFREEGVAAITVSSLDMAEYFADHGWQDITLAFPINIRQIDRINTLAARIHFGILVETPEVVRFLEEHLKTPVNVWLKVDTGYRRTGVPWDNDPALETLAASAGASSKMRLAGLLTHGGQTYHARSKQEVCRLFSESIQRLEGARERLLEKGFSSLEISAGDTPAVSLCKLEKVDELRPGNFIFYDIQQLQIGSCSEENIAVALACPVVALHPERNEITIYGGAIHLSSQPLDKKGSQIFGRVVLPEGDHWSRSLKGACVRWISQEHGIVHLETADIRHIRVGDLIGVLPVHSCLTAHLMRSYTTLEGRLISTMNSFNNPLK